MHRKKIYIETYGCQMNVNDSEVVASLLETAGMAITADPLQADIVLINTCAIRDNAEVRVLGRLAHFKHLRQTSMPSLIIGVLGCMASRLRTELLAPDVGANLVVGPDSYRHLPELIARATRGEIAAETTLSRDETYSDIIPVRYATNGISAFTSIMRGCDNVCTYCVVPFTRGRERSRSPHTIVDEVKMLASQGFREVTLLGQNVDSYRWQPEQRDEVHFADLLEMVAKCAPAMRVRFSTSHPKDLTDEVLYTMAMYENICPHIHLPVQSGSDRMLKLMHRHYTRKHYLQRIEAIRKLLPGCSITTDFIAGFCCETAADHQETLRLMEEVRFDFAYMFKYSERPGTFAARRLTDDVEENVKNARLEEIIALQTEHSKRSNQADVGQKFEVLIEGESKRSSEDFCGRTPQNKMAVFPRGAARPGEYVEVRVEDCSSSTLLGKIV